jgi:hypothetical protein
VYYLHKRHRRERPVTVPLDVLEAQSNIVEVADHIL